ncbi:NCS1 nucleoside transporter [Colletotrichum navitas]|uniref:NCS1 nucleoside transporter n=1 Tax=Colletotrichum navitas TaxID=681940 RepID=A0AAD8UY68_9PEZI|nr:NCS1 nucleoside transporter [Colletotrichum navitas]KAK1564221.1 NCS1 nucleoside transporter [Colletotrichum navitas]
MGLLNRIRVAPAAGATEVHGRDALLENDDLRPLTRANRTFTQVTYITFWFSATATVSNWYASSTAQALGLSMWESLACAFGGQCLIAIIITLNGRPGSCYHVGYPIVCRAAFGVYGAWWPTFNRAVMATVWLGVSAVQGGECIYVMLHAIIPGIAKIPNMMGEGSALTSGGMIGFVIFWLVTCAFLVIPVPKMRGLVYAKLGVFIVSAVAMLAWTATKAGGLGPVMHQGGKATGSKRAWLIVQFFMLGAANCATFASNAADFQRYAKKKNDVIIGNLFCFPIANLVVAAVGNLVCASSELIFGELIWNPVTLLDTLQTAEYTAANRAGCFIIAGCFAYCCIFSSIFENSLPAGNDIAALFPKYFTVRRGFFVCAVVSFAINPWYLLGSASIFVSFLSSYQIFLSAITGVLLVNYYVIGRGRLDIPDCFSSAKSGAYHYSHGWNIRAYAAYIIGIIPNFYGFLNNMGVSAPVGVTRFYFFAYWVGLALSGFTFWLTCKIWPPPIMEDKWIEPKDYVRPEELEGDGPVIEAINLPHESSLADNEKSVHEKTVRV